MAANFLPLVLLGAGGAYVLTQSKKKDKHKCPAEVKTTLGEAESAAQRASAKHGDTQDPFKEAEFFVSALLPKGCGPSSHHTRIKATLELPKVKEPITFDLSATDLYMLAVGQAIGRRVASGKLTDNQAEEKWAEALTWYKKTTGKEFDATSLGLEIFEDLDGFMNEIAKGLKEAVGKGKKPTKPGAGCPPEYVFEVTDEILAQMDRTGKIAAMKTPDPYAIANAVFESLVPRGCTKESKDTIIEIKHGAGRGFGHLPQIMALPTFYAAIVLGSLETLFLSGVVPPPPSQQAAEAVARSLHKSVSDWHRGVMGRPLPPELQLPPNGEAIDF